jgi:phenylalanine ammonia-lyase
VEDIVLAHDQIAIEMNSTTDNPLIDSLTGEIYHGGNFQAVSVATAMEKCRLAVQAIGRMLYAQFTEMCNHATNRGLPPNLCVDDPSISFTFKGVDIAMAAYISELSFLANPVHNHVVSAEMGNQALNSLALISARYTDTAVDVFVHMCASALYANCQGLDLRALMRIFQKRLKEELELQIEGSFGNILQGGALSQARSTVWEYVHDELNKTSAMGVNERIERIMVGAKVRLLESLDKLNDDENATVTADILARLSAWASNCTRNAVDIFNSTRSSYLKDGDASPLLGKGSKRLYNFVRKELHLPMHRGVVDHPRPPPMGSAARNKTNGAHSEGINGSRSGTVDEDDWRKKTIGHWITVIYEAIKDDSIMDIVVECLKDGAGGMDS